VLLCLWSANASSSIRDFSATAAPDTEETARGSVLV
jgi:hypothetical protein